MSLDSISASISPSLEEAFRLSQERTDFPVAVVLQSPSDWNQAYNHPFLNYDLVELAKTHQVYFRIIDDVSKFHQALQEISEKTHQPIKYLIIRAHGRKDSVSLDGAKMLSGTDFTEADIKTLDPAGSIFFYSCYTGQQLAQRVHKISRINVFAPKVPCSWGDTYIHFCPVHHHLEMSSKFDLYHDAPTCPVEREALAERFRYLAFEEESGNVDAQFDLALCYWRGVGVTADRDTAFKWFLEAARHNSVLAMKTLGLMYKTGEFVPRSDIEAAKWYEMAAREGDPASQFVLAHLYWDGLGVEKSLDTAIGWIKAAASQGHAEAEFSLGICYLHGIGVTFSLQEALRHITAAVKQGNVFAIHFLMVLAQGGLAEAQYELALCFLEGRGVEKSEMNGIRYLMDAVDQRHTRALPMLEKYAGAGCDLAELEMGNCYVRGVGGLAPSYLMAAKWYEAAKTHGNLDALIKLGRLYLYGYGVPLNVPLAIDYYNYAARQGDDAIQYELGMIYLDGVYVPKDVASGVQWLKSSAELGNAQAFFALAKCFRDGIGVPQSDSDAEACLLQAANRGHSGAIAKLQPVMATAIV